jgi:protein-L-isoaspartate(D-aspartate) O-methyltransferase
MPNGDEPNARLREQMVADQLVARGVRDPRVLDAMRRVPRHLFVPPESETWAYADRALSIAQGQAISQPYMVAVMTEALALRGDERVLEIGTGSGYQAAILAELAREVITIERLGGLASAARALLGRCHYANVRVLVGDGTEGFADAAPYDGIIVTAGAPHALTRLEAQLADNGKLVVPIGPRDHQRLSVLTRRGESFTTSTLDQCVFVPLVGRDGWAE